MIAQHSEIDYGVIKHGVLLASLSALAVGLIGCGFDEAKRLVAERRERAKNERGDQ